MTPIGKQLLETKKSISEEVEEAIIGLGFHFGSQALGLANTESDDDYLLSPYVANKISPYINEGNAVKPYKNKYGPSTTVYVKTNHGKIINLTVSKDEETFSIWKTAHKMLEMLCCMSPIFKENVKDKNKRVEMYTKLREMLEINKDEADVLTQEVIPPFMCSPIDVDLEFTSYTTPNTPTLAQCPQCGSFNAPGVACSNSKCTISKINSF